MVQVGPTRQKSEPVTDGDVPALIAEATQLEEAGQRNEAVEKLEALLKRLSAKQKPQKIDVFGKLHDLYEAMFTAVQDEE